MNKRIPKITLSTDINLFFSRLKGGDIFRYSIAYMFTEIKKMAENRRVDIDIEYCKPGSREHKKYGHSTVRVITNEEKEKEKIFHFNPQYLDI
jgi:hypothetical protein